MIPNKKQITLALEAVEPLADAFRKAGFNCEVHAWGGSLISSTSGAQLHVTRQGENWGHNLQATCLRDTGQVESISSRVRGQRTITLRSLTPENIKKLVDRASADLAADKQAMADADKAQEAHSQWLIRAAHDFEGWSAPEFLRYEYANTGSLHHMFMHFQYGERKLGLYTLDLHVGKTFPNLNAAQVKALCAFLQDTLPTIK